MNHEQLNAIKQRVEKTTPGPWDIEPLAGILTNETTIWMDTDDYIQVHGSSIIQSTNDALFILHAIEDVPALITEIERLRKALSYYADEKHYESYGSFNTGSCDVTEDEGYIARQALEGESDEH